MPDSALPAHLRGTLHWDFPPGLRWVPRGWTAWSWGAPVLVAGNQVRTRFDSGTGRQRPAPIGEPGSWQVSRFPRAPWGVRWFPLYIAWTTRGGRHFRVGFRWDDVDNYVNGPTVASRRFPASGDGARDTSTR